MIAIIFFNLLSFLTQETPLVGKVVDQSGSSITSAKVVCEGKTYLTDLEGNFSLLSTTDTITISALGYQTAKVPTSTFSGVVVLKPSVPKAVTFRK